MDLGVAFKKPFSNITNLIIGIILSLIPIINVLTIPGYLLRVAKKTMSKDKSLPNFSNFGELVVDSIKAIIVMFIHGIILGVIAFILALIPFVGPIIAIIWTIVYAFVMISGMMTLADTKSIGAALNVPALFKKAKRASFIIAVIVGAIIVGIIQAIITAIFGSVAFAQLLPMFMGQTIDIVTVMNAMMSLLATAFVAVIVMVIVGYILNIFYVTIVAESYK